MECPYRALPEFEFRVADVAVVSRVRWDSAEQCLFGSPELVVEVKSPSNALLQQLSELTALCLANGALQCWIVEADPKTVTVFRPDGTRQVYGAGAKIPLDEFGGPPVPVSEIFG